MSPASTHATRLSLRAEQARWQLALPDGARRMMASGDFEGRDHDALVRWLASDRQLAERLLRWCNCPLYNLSSPFASLEDAAAVMEPGDLSRLALLAYVRGLFEPDVVIDCYQRDALWRHSIAVGAVASMISRTCGFSDPSLVLVAGALHDIGLIANERIDQATFSDIVIEIDELTPTCHVERERFGWDHTDLGAAILKHWGMPEEIQMAAKWHHRPDRAHCRDYTETISCVAIANHLCSRSGWTSMGSHNVAAPPESSFRCLGINADLLTILWQQLYPVLDAVSALR